MISLLPNHPRRMTMEKFIDALWFYFINDGRCLVGTIVSALFCAWFIWVQEMHPEVQTPGKNWWLPPLGEVTVAFFLGAIFWPLGLVALVALVLLYALDAFGGAPKSTKRRPPDDDILGHSGTCVGR